MLEGLPVEGRAALGQAEDDGVKVVAQQSRI
jgi:hypothetical protein